MTSASYLLKPKVAMSMSGPTTEPPVTHAGDVGPIYDGGHFDVETQNPDATVSGRPKSDCHPTPRCRSATF